MLQVCLTIHCFYLHKDRLSIVSDFKLVGENISVHVLQGLRGTRLVLEEHRQCNAITGFEKFWQVLRACKNFRIC